MQTTMRTVDLERIQQQDRTFVVTAGRAVARLAQSIRSIGLINPPHLAAAGASGSYRIVCGFRRIEALARLGYAQVPARICEPLPAERDLLLFALHDNIGQRDFNPVEQGEAICRLCRYVRPDEVIATYLPLLGLPASARALGEALALGQADEGLKQAMVQGDVHQRAALSLAAMQPGDREAMISLFRHTHMSASKQAEVIEACDDLARRERSAVAAVLQDQAVQSVLRRADLSLSQKGDQVRLWLRRRRLPRLVHSEEQFARTRRRLKLPANMQLQPPPFFEGSAYVLHIALEKRADLAAAAHELPRLAADPLLQNLLEQDR